MLDLALMQGSWSHPNSVPVTVVVENRRMHIRLRKACSPHFACEGLLESGVELALCLHMWGCNLNTEDMHLNNGPLLSL